ncbi:MAG: SDR family NAD(P)-dependent oxidoreductase, partial [Gammaproteobacteria bacterium]|nr:SDR family NAD(P)-dependent oxidoreductase [Gammaproteobacteria bacterium]
MHTRLVFITGASSGIGQALALRYAKAGCRLALVGRRSS